MAVSALYAGFHGVDYHFSVAGGAGRTGLGHSKLKQNSIFLRLYAEGNGGGYPSELGTFFTAGYLTDDDLLHCPSYRRVTS